MINGRTVFEMDPAAFGAAVPELISAGASILGGCCGTTPEHLKAMNEVFRKSTLLPIETPVSSAVSSPSHFREIAPGKPFTLIGERINPTGKKALQAELREGKTDIVFDFATQQLSAGAEILDVNMGLSGIDEAEMMQSAIFRIVKSTPAILCIDSTNPATVERALRLYPGRALLNSISAEEKRLKEVLPIAAKYGAMLILLPLTDAGLPKSGGERFEILQTIIAEAEKYGYEKSDFCVDALILAVSTDPGAGQSALDFISRCCKENFNTVCGLSNISFGLPNRPLVNRTFLSMAMGCGLNMAIANPLFTELTDEITAANALRGLDGNMADFLAKFADISAAKPVASAAQSPAERLYNTVLAGDVDGVKSRIDVLLQSGMTPESIINEILIPAITEVGSKYEKKEFFLPQLISGAEAMSCGTAYLEPMLIAKADTSSASHKVIIATVKGDIHDIGKNIVAVILRNYGFEVIDLGKDVPPETILDCAVKNDIKVICLSALMTTTMNAMREVIELAKKRKLDDFKFIIGGAVVDDNFAAEIGAVYAETPMDTVHLAETISSAL